MIAPARRAAYAVLRAVSDNSLDLPAALARAREGLSDPRDRALAAEVAIGALRWRGALDAMIATLARRPLTKLDPEVVDILRLSLYQLWHLERVPPAAVVDDGVELTRAARRGRASTLVNAALRAFTRTTAARLLPGRSADPLDYLSITLSHPRWLVERWLDRHGFDAAERWLRFNNRAAPLTLRVNTVRTTAAAVRETLAAHGAATEPARYAPDALVVSEGNPIATPAFAAGDFIVQDEASQLVAHMAGVRPGERILDACAAPGGKTVVMAAEARGEALVVAADVRARRVGLLVETLRRTGTAARVLQMDLGRPVPLQPVFDCVLVDAPCSGLGTVRRDPDIKWRRDADALPALAAAQRALLANAAAAVRPGGRLVYATCSSEPEENDEVVEAFLESDCTFAPLPRAGVERLPRGSVLSAVCDERGRLRTQPWRHELEAFFAAVLVKAKPL